MGHSRRADRWRLREAPMSAEFRTCFGCKHFNFSQSDPGYSEYTPGSDASLVCLKNVWDISLWRDTEKSLYDKIVKMAATCPHYTFDEERAR